jgi:hypothetical protein
MEVDHLLKEGLGDTGCRVWVTQCEEMRIFEGMINNREDHRLTPI